MTDDPLRPSLPSNHRWTEPATFTPERPDFWKRAVCRGLGPAMWFPEQHADPAGVATAKRYCAVCPVIEQCLAFALDNRVPHGVFGGLSPDERRAMLRARKATVRSDTGGYRA